MSLKKPKSNFSSTKLKKLRKPPPKVATKAQIVATRNVESDESDSSENILSDDENQWKDTKRMVADPTPDYHAIQKLVKYAKAGNTTATIVSLCCLKDYDLSISINQLVRDFYSTIFVRANSKYFIALYFFVSTFFVFVFNSKQFKGNSMEFRFNTN